LLGYAKNAPRGQIKFRKQVASTGWSPSTSSG
jgi:hypothetical protein